MQKLLLVILLFICFKGIAQKQSADTFVCPPCSGDCDSLVFTKAGKCPHCGMGLVSKASVKPHEKQLTVCFYLQDGVEALDFVGPLEVFSYAGFKIFTVSKTKAPITSQGILKVIPDYDIKDAPAFDILAVFGGNSGVASGDPAVISWIQSRKSTIQYYFSVCTGAFILGKAGILDSLTITTFHLSIDGLRKAVPSAHVLADKRFIDNGKVITTAGISAGIDGALYLVTKLDGAEGAKQIAAYMEYDKWVPGQGLVMGKK